MWVRGYKMMVILRKQRDRESWRIHVNMKGPHGAVKEQRGRCRKERDGNRLGLLSPLITEDSPTY